MLIPSLTEFQIQRQARKPGCREREKESPEMGKMGRGGSHWLGKQHEGHWPLLRSPRAPPVSGCHVSGFVPLVTGCPADKGRAGG